MLRTVIALLVGSALLSAARADIPFQAGADKKPDPAAPVKSTEKIVEEINIDLGKVVDQLTKSDPGAATRAGQDRILENIDLLLKQQAPSPPKNSSQNPPSSPPSPKSPSAKQPDPQPNVGDPMNQPKPQPAKQKAAENPKQQLGSSEQQNQKPNTIEELRKEMGERDWGKQPSHLRQALDSMAGARFIPSYEELLRAYFRNLAESSRRKDVD